MDWPKDFACLGENESALKNVFKYEAAPSLVVEILHSTNYKFELSIFETDSDWKQWAEAIDKNDRGLILILATRVGSQTIRGKITQPFSVDDWLSEARELLSTPLEKRRMQILSPLAEEPQTAKNPSSRSVRTVPFSQETFKLLSYELQIHESIKRTISRSDVATFHADKVSMQKPAIVYSCRTSDAWHMDLALSQTHYPQVGLSLAILYGCDMSTSRDVIERLKGLREEVAHPMLIPGVFAEIEHARQITIVEKDVAAVETKILELDNPEHNTERQRFDALHNNISKRSAWLDLAYLRDSLIHWNSQQTRMTDHIQELKMQNLQVLLSRGTDHTRFEGKEPSTSSRDFLRFSTSTSTSTIVAEDHEHSLSPTTPQRKLIDPSIAEEKEQDARNIKKKLTSEDQKPEPTASQTDQPEFGDGQPEYCTEYHSEPRFYGQEKPYCEEREVMIELFGDKMRQRLMILRTEFEEMIRSCTMRLEGMAMATQWSHSETNVEIASATRRDSRVMKSISLVTMIFLPGTFLATVFSMTFFDWSSNPASNDKALVSHYIWIYFVFAAFSTVGTVVAWYYFVIARRRFKATTTNSSNV